jgi:hypothetical protein
MSELVTQECGALQQFADRFTELEQKHIDFWEIGGYADRDYKAICDLCLEVVKLIKDIEAKVASSDEAGRKLFRDASELYEVINNLLGYM